MRVSPFVALVGLVGLAACGASDLGAVEGPSNDGGVDAAHDDASDAAIADAASDAFDAAVDARDARDARDAPDGGLPATVTPGAVDRILLVGTVITPDVSFDGQVLVEGSVITCVAPALGCQGQVGAVGATIIDTHTADGLKVGREHRTSGVPTLVLETALPAKFAETIVEAIGREPDRPAAMQGIEKLPKRFAVMAPDVQAVKRFIVENA